MSFRCILTFGSHFRLSFSFQHRFVEGWLAKLSPVANAGAKVALSAIGFGAVPLPDLKTVFGHPLHSYNQTVVQLGDILLVPSELKTYATENPKTINWAQGGDRSAQYYCFTVVNSTQSLYPRFFAFMFSVIFTRFLQRART